MSAETAAAGPVTRTPLGDFADPAATAAHYAAKVSFETDASDVAAALGGFEYWARERYPVEGGSGPIRRAIDPPTARVEHAISCDC